MGGQSRVKIIKPKETSIERTKSAGQISNDGELQIQANASANRVVTADYMTDPFGPLHQEPEAAGRIKTTVEIHREASMHDSAGILNV